MGGNNSYYIDIDDNKMEEKINPKPSRSINLILFILFYLITTNTISAIRYGCDYGTISLLEHYMGDAMPQKFLCLIIIPFVAGIIVAIKTIITTLRGSEEWLFSLRMCLIFLIYSQILISPYASSMIQFWITNIFLTISLGYLLLSAKIRKQYPRPNRKIGVNGILWISIFASIALIFTIELIQALKTDNDPNQCFKSREPNEMENPYFFLNEYCGLDGNTKTYTGKCLSPDIRTHNLIIYELLRQHQHQETCEQCITDTVVNGNQVYINTFYFADGEPTTVSTIYHRDSDKFATILTSCHETTLYGIIQRIDFNLEDGILKESIDKIGCH